ncbi:hypothetical protein [Planctomicrobium sp. SH527]|uniref:hypothetical protein n=1 Tax=Planctomicrobium sp. SH527 TaxID=3448123 RepID=UPI003F5C3B16
MRIALLMTLLMTSGCHHFGGSAFLSSRAFTSAGDCQADCRSCSTWSRLSEKCLQTTLGCFGRHPKYCSTHDKMLTQHDARHLAHAELKRSKKKICSDCDYRLGFEQAFVDVSQGAKGDVPALPPANFWTNCARTPGGHQRAENWFSGYAAGATAAKAIYEPYNKVAASQFYNDVWTERDGASAPQPTWGGDSGMYQ